MMRAPILALVPLALLAACGSADPDAVLDTVHATEQAQIEAMASKDLRGAVRVYADDAVMVAPGSAPASGAAAIGTVFEGLLKDPNLAIKIAPGPAWASSSGDMAVTTFTGEFTTTDAASGEPVTVPVGNQTVWRKVDGTPWQIVSDYNVALPAAEAVQEAAAGDTPAP